MMEIEDVPTPALVLNVDALERNLHRMAGDCRAAGVALRPHTKTHKSAWIARRQLRLGAAGVCAAKVGEAEVLVQAGIEDVLITTDLVPSTMERGAGPRPPGARDGGAGLGGDGPGAGRAGVP